MNQKHNTLKANLDKDFQFYRMHKKTSPYNYKTILKAYTRRALRNYLNPKNPSIL